MSSPNERGSAWMPESVLSAAVIETSRSLVSVWYPTFAKSWPMRDGLRSAHPWSCSALPVT